MSILIRERGQAAQERASFYRDNLWLRVQAINNQHLFFVLGCQEFLFFFLFVLYFCFALSVPLKFVEFSCHMAVTKC